EDHQTCCRQDGGRHVLEQLDLRQEGGGQRGHCQPPGNALAPRQTDGQAQEPNGRYGGGGRLRDVRVNRQQRGEWLQQAQVQRGRIDGCNESGTPDQGRRNDGYN